MVKKSITYTDFNDVERTEDFYFNLTKAEIAEAMLSTEGDIAEQLQAIVAAQDKPAIMKVFKEVLMKAYGEKSADGKRFVKSPEISEAFTQTAAYDVLFMELVTNAEAAADFVNSIIPKELRDGATEAIKTAKATK